MPTFTRPLYDLTCQVCKAEFKGTKKAQKYCSNKCSCRAKVARNPERYAKLKYDHYTKDREAYHQRNNRWRKAHPECRAKSDHAYRARKRNNPHNQCTKAWYAIFTGPLVAKVCVYCGKRCDRGEWHVDHYVPISKGGPDAPWNLRISCKECNMSKSNKLPEEHL